MVIEEVGRGVGVFPFFAVEVLAGEKAMDLYGREVEEVEEKEEEM